MSNLQLPGAWRPRLIGAPGDNPYHDWLIDDGSLTARIRARCRDFALEVLRQEMAPPWPDEVDALDLRRKRRAWVREVVLWADGRPVVFAHSVLARENAGGAWMRVAGMGTRPLGAALFADPRVRRAPLEFLRIDARHPLWPGARRAAASEVRGLWARRSRFSLCARPLLVTEVFLPEILHLRT